MSLEFLGRVCRESSSFELFIVILLYLVLFGVLVVVLVGVVDLYRIYIEVV